MKARTDAKRHEILKVAGAVFLAVGYERTSMAEIAARVGGSKATLYGYFPSKEALFLAILRCRAEQYMMPALARLEGSGEQDVRSELRTFGAQFLAFISTQEAVATYRVILSEAARSRTGHSFLELGPKLCHEALTRYLLEAMRRGQLRAADAAVAACHFLALLTHGEIWQHYFIREAPALTGAHIEGIVERAVDAFLKGYQH